MPRRERSLSKSMRRLSRPISLIFSEISAKKTLESFASLEVLSSFEDAHHTRLEKALQLDFETEQQFSFDPELASPGTSASASPSSSRSGSISRLSGSWHVERKKGIYIYQEDACISEKEAYNPWL